MESLIVQIKKEFKDLPEDNPDMVDVKKCINPNLIANNSTKSEAEDLPDSVMNKSLCMNVKTEFKEENDNSSTDLQNQCDTNETNRSKEEEINCKSEHHCIVCGKNFPVQSALQAHISAMHTKEKPYICPICGKTSSYSSNLKKHMAVHSDEYPYQCELCPMKFKTKQTHTRHTQRHKRKELQCEICHKVFDTKTRIKVHLKMHKQIDDYERNKRTYSCAQCGKTYKCMSGLSRHMRHHTNELFKCHVCEKSYESSNRLRIHLRSHTGERPYECEICNQKFISKATLNSHKGIHDSNRKTYKCDLCDKVLVSKKTLHTHRMVMHSTEKNHHCGLCEQKFKLQSKLTEHLRKCHSEWMEEQMKQNQQTPFKCHICNKLYLEEYRLHIHLKQHNEKPTIHKCEDCGKEFTKKDSFRYHKKTHENNRKKYKCNLCDKAYTDDKQLHCHIIDTHRTENYECQLCGEKFETDQELQEHLCPQKKERENHRMELNEAATSTETNTSDIYHSDCSVEGLEAHFSTNDVKPFKCECFMVFFSENEYKKHLKNECEVVKGNLEHVEDVKEELEIASEVVKKEENS